VADEVQLIKEENPIPTIQTQQPPSPGSDVQAAGGQQQQAGMGGAKEKMPVGATSGADSGSNGQAPPGGY
jgi:hypothetical protein